MNHELMTRKDFEQLPYRKEWNIDVKCDVIVILPTRKKHDSGWRLMDFVAVRDGEAICRLSGSSDVLNLDGIGGFGHNWYDKYNAVPSMIPPSGWSIDCLPKSGLLRVWPSSVRILAGSGLSNFEIYALPRQKGI